jgi:ketosteroid isomerase-like protein
MHPNAEIIDSFYRAFEARDAEGMARHYAPDVRFSDPVFTDLRGDEARSMWRMLLARGADLQVTHRDVSADDRSGRAYWEARYTFSGTGRKVLNKIHAEFELEDGKIVEHTDRFDLWAWTKQALGPAGLLLGWSPIVQGPLRKRAKKELLRYMEKHPR